ncbi:MAG: hypothetical protein DHS20C18_04770 [Saprospiraceae bacterium]|nr:MAG: hypothetical protein DHS20C18_04770 [Saprospiraceae bacterium]
MNLRTAILNEHSKANTTRITNWIGNNQQRFDALVELFLYDEYRVVQRAGWVLSECALQHTELLQPHLGPLIDNLEHPKHNAVLRNTLKALAEIDIPEEHMGKLATISFDLLADPQSAIATKVFAMQVLANFCKKEPDLAPELCLLIEDQWEHASAGFKSRGRKILKKLKPGKR